MPPTPSAPAVLDALVRAYPGRIESPGIRLGDWSVLIDGRVFLWAEGRMLPSEEAENKEKYRPYSFIPYPSELPEPPELNEDEIRRLEELISIRETLQDSRSQSFLTALWGMEDFLTAERTVVPMKFLGFNVRVHPDIKDALAGVEQMILHSAENDPELRAWLDGLGSVGAYNWRNIAGSANRSLHSYGIAVDLVPADLNGGPAYWRWARNVYDRWWAVPQADRFPFPQTLVEAFEAHGFIWGGKWFLYDRIHFEYRPELFFIPEGAAPVRRGL